MTYSFFAAMSRMKYIDRWNLMRSSRSESLSEHATEVAMIAHALCVIGNVRFGKNLPAKEASLLGIYHDASEIITGDMPTPVKYQSEEIKSAYKKVEEGAINTLLDQLPDDIRQEYENIFRGEDSLEDKYMRRLVKAADKISAFIMCIDEEKSGNTEFSMAKKSILSILKELREELPEVRVFMEEFLPAYGKTLDELLK